MGASLTSFAAWEPVGEDWIFTDSSGRRVTNSWRESGSQMFYLGDDGIMVRSQWIDGTYYVSSSGARAANRWVYAEEGTREAPNGGDRTGISRLKYFGDENDGRMARGWKYLLESPEENSEDFSFELATSSNASYYNN